ncbi:HAD-IIB family hydrolase [Kiritimatiella glycovorans]|uniref:Mannosylfructose-phosphate phosphatase n=1 Tax=Kiritimatiella glycovorans TaxID=1307763 RepID=A0A0G3ED39_9BACT|nr:HAD-IIB family hydrolase [Kiritimatiella glycovorans]AKJ64233.1 Mannosylfructose-phosphate phosphatase [Kiritimatiella glycovorans]
MSTTHLLASDMDGTALPSRDDAAGHRAAKALARALHASPSTTFACVTGRSLALALEALNRYPLPRPRYIAGDVGTTVHEYREGAWSENPDYAGQMQRAMGGVRAADLAHLADDLTGLSLQEPEKQARWKCSFYVDAQCSHQKVCDEVRRVLRGKGAQVQLVYSRDLTDGTGLIDLLPSGVTKDTAVRFLRRRLGVADENLVYAGDSGNDLAAFLGGWCAVVVANTPDDVRAALDTAVRENRIRPERIYYAARPCTEGVIEGARHFGVLEAC